MTLGPGLAAKAQQAPSRTLRPASRVADISRAVGGRDAGGLRRLQQTLGNLAMSRMASAEQGALAAIRQSPARPLEPALQRQMEGRFGEDLSSVRVHTDPAACDAVGANAYTIGEHIVFNADAYAPPRQAGQGLLAHELSHVIQQRRGAGPASAGIEGEAAGIGRAAAFGSGPLAVERRAPVGLARDKIQASPPLDSSEVDRGGETTVYIEGVAVLRFPTANAGKVMRIIRVNSDEPNTIYILVHATSDSGARVDEAGLTAVGKRHDVKATFDTEIVPYEELDRGARPSLDLSPTSGPPSPKPPPPPAAKDRPPVKKPSSAPADPPELKLPELKPPDLGPLAPTVDAQPLSPSTGPTPTTLQPPTPPPVDLADRLATIRDRLAHWSFNRDGDILDAFKGLSPADFVRLQDELSEDEMNDVFDELSAFMATVVGTYGPIVKGRDKLNENRVAFIKKSRDWGSPKEVLYRWIFASMTLDDIHDVLRQLADAKRLHETVLTVPGLADNLIARGVDESELTEQDTTFLQGVGRGLGHVWSWAWSSTIFADGPSGEFLYMPQNYQELYVNNLSQDFANAMTPTNVVRGALSNVTLGVSDIPFGLYDAGKLTVEAAQDLWNGKTGAATEKLTPIVVMILAAVITHKVAKMGGTPAIRGSTALAPVETALVESKTAAPVLVDTPSVGGGAPEWDVRKVGTTADGADRYIGRHSSGEFVELVVDPRKGTMRATRLATGEVAIYENGEVSRGGLPALTDGDLSIVDPTSAPFGQPPAFAAPDLTSKGAQVAQVAPPLLLEPTLPESPGAAPKAAPLMLPPGPLPPLQLQPFVYENFADLGQELAQTPESGFGAPMVWSVTAGGVAFATPPVPGVPLYAPQGPLPPSSYFTGQPLSWTLSGPLQPNFTPFDVLPGRSSTSQTLSQVRGARGPNARGAAGELHVAELGPGSSREITLDLPGGLTRRSDVLSPTVAGTVNQEAKNYLRFRGSGSGAREVELTPFLQTEINRDAMAIYYYGHQPVWVFTDAPPSAALQSALSQAGIPYVVSSDRLPTP